MQTKLSRLAVLVGLTGTAPSLPSEHAHTAEEAEQSHHGPRPAGEPAAPGREETSMHTIRPDLARVRPTGSTDTPVSTHTVALHMIAGRDRGSRARVIVRAMTFALLCLTLSGAALAFAAPVGQVPDEVLVRFRAGTSNARRSALHAAAGATVVRQFASVPDLQLLKLPAATALRCARALRSQPRRAVRRAQPRHHAAGACRTIPRFVAADSGMWGLNMRPALQRRRHRRAGRPGTSRPGSRNVVVATIDSGIDYTHEDLAANMWRNEADCNDNGVDDDGNGFVDDCYGIAPINGNSDPMDDHCHGTHVAGTIGAVGNNGVGVVGVNWNVRLMSCKMFDAGGNGSLAAAIACLDYVAMMKDRGVNVVATNNSWSDNEYSAALRDAIDAHRQRGILFVAAAGNYYQCADDPYECRTDTDNDRKPTWPASFYLPNIISVANSVDYGFLNAASGRGRHTVHLAAPGTFILSTTPGEHVRLLHGHVDGHAARHRRRGPAQGPEPDARLEGHQEPDPGRHRRRPVPRRRRPHHPEAAECPRLARVREQHGDVPAAAGPPRR